MFYMKNKSGSIACYLDPNDVWVGWYRGENHHYICLVPMWVIRLRRGHAPI